MKEDFVTQAPSISTAVDVCFLSLNCMCFEIDKNIYEASGQLDVLNSLPSGKTETGIW
jgi:anaerobic glycerol-3-phosphate dehydrogenase